MAQRSTAACRRISWQIFEPTRATNFYGICGRWIDGHMAVLKKIWRTFLDSRSTRGLGVP
jgi:hypothetical protein